MVGLRLDCSWVLHGFSLEFPLNFPLKCCLECAWNLPWNRLEFCLGAPWNFLECSSGVLLGICLEFYWVLHIGSHWNLHGIVLWSADWTLLGISSERPLALAFSGFWQKMVRNPNTRLTLSTSPPESRLEFACIALGFRMVSLWNFHGIFLRSAA